MWNSQHVVTVVDRVITLPAAVQQTVRLDDAVVKTTVGARTRSASSIPDWRGWRSSWTMQLRLSFSGLLLLLPADRKKQARAPCIIARGRRAAAHVACSGWTSSDVRRRSYRLDEHSFKFGYSWPVTQIRYFITTSIPISGFNLPKRSEQQLWYWSYKREFVCFMCAALRLVSLFSMKSCARTWSGHGHALATRGQECIALLLLSYYKR